MQHQLRVKIVEEGCVHRGDGGEAVADAVLDRRETRVGLCNGGDRQRCSRRTVALLFFNTAITVSLVAVLRARPVAGAVEAAASLDQRVVPPDHLRHRLQRPKALNAVLRQRHLTRRVGALSDQKSHL